MKVKLFHKDVTILFEPEPTLADGTKAYGFCDMPNSRIVISKNIKPDNQKEVMLHELIHAIDDLLNIRLSERETHQLSVGLYTVLKDNPKLRVFLFGGK